jgi:hypothetical protein
LNKITTAFVAFVFSTSSVLAERNMSCSVSIGDGNVEFELTLRDGFNLSDPRHGDLTIRNIEVCLPLPFGCSSSDDWRIVDTDTWDNRLVIALRRYDGDGSSNNWRWFRLDPYPNSSGQYAITVEPGGPIQNGPFYGNCS